jgi:F-type H+-transporting ATPase subunit b
VGRDEILEQARKDAEASIQQAVGELRKEMADLTVLATEKVTRKTLTEEDQRKLVEEALSELDFTALSGEQRRN